MARAVRPAANHIVRRALSQPAARGGIGVGAMAVGMAGAAAGGIGIGLMLPTNWLQDLSSELQLEVDKDLREQQLQEQLQQQQQQRAAAASSADAKDEQEQQRENSTYENVKDIAEDIPRPAIIQDATREEVEKLYEFHSCIASGGSAAVWRATEIATGKQVAIKVVDKRLLLAPFLNMEVASLVRCAGHANIVQLHAAYDIGPDDFAPEGEWHLVLELAEGGELFERLVEHGAYTEKVASTLIRQVARAVYYMHSVGICHRDIKPENVVLVSKEADSPVKLIDFGAAVLLEEGEHVIAGGKVRVSSPSPLLLSLSASPLSLSLSLSASPHPPPAASRSRRPFPPTAPACRRGLARRSPLPAPLRPHRPDSPTPTPSPLFVCPPSLFSRRRFARLQVGTWTYWAPEQADAAKAYDQAVDMWSVGVLLYIMLSGRHPFERPAAGRGRGGGADDGTDRIMSNILHARYSFDAAAWNGISGRARQLVTQLLEPDPAKRLTAAQLLAHSWVRGEGVPERPLPDTVERLRAFKTASTAIHGSLLMAALLHQEGVRAQLARTKASKASWLGAALGKRTESGTGPGGDSSKGALLRRTTTEGVGTLQPEEDFNVVRAAWRLFDPDDKGHISADDLYRVCNQLGYPVSERDVENMLSVLAPSETASGERVSAGSSAGGSGAGGGAGGVGLAASASASAPAPRAISYDKFAKMMESSYRRTYKPGEAIFSQGDAVDGFYIVTHGECRVQVSARQGEDPKEITKLGPGDFFGETGLLEGRGTRNSSVICTTPVEVLMIDNAMVCARLRMQQRGGVAHPNPRLPSRLQFPALLASCQPRCSLQLLLRRLAQ
jgi:serine/threonine protein kinase/ribosomal protein L12E/L44/L45/RPP1/RPP2